MLASLVVSITSYSFGASTVVKKNKKNNEDSYKTSINIITWIRVGKLCTLRCMLSQLVLDLKKRGARDIWRDFCTLLEGWGRAIGEANGFARKRWGRRLSSSAEREVYPETLNRVRQGPTLNACLFSLDKAPTDQLQPLKWPLWLAETASSCRRET